MKLFNNSKYYSNKILNTKEFWLKHKAKFYYQLLIALSPLMLFILYISFGIFNPRYQKNLASIYILISVLLIYLPAIITRKLNNPYVLVAILILWLVISITTFNKKILKRY
jgi:lipopolysaccharide export LptBFGC system permease protein LptF